MNDARAFLDGLKPLLKVAAGLVSARRADRLHALPAGVVILGSGGNLRPRHLASADKADLLAMVAFDRIFLDKALRATLDPEVSVGAHQKGWKKELNWLLTAALMWASVTRAA
jgi:hypothetical protein